MLGRLWGRIVRGRQTVSEVASDFTSQFLAVKLILCEWFAAEFAKNGGKGTNPVVPNPEFPVVVATQVVNFLMGHLFDPFDERVEESVRNLSLQISGDIPEIASNLMNQNKDLRELVVYTLRMRLVLGSVHDKKLSETKEGERICKLLELYGEEFQTEITEQQYSAFVNKWIAWAESPDFPGKHVD